MALLQGIFQADFTSFVDACAKAEVSLKGFQTDAAKTEVAVTKMADSLSGQKIVQQAMMATKAVEDIGGAAVLTEKELARMSAIAAEGVEKLEKAGQTVPADMRRLADETKGAADATASWSSALKNVQGYLGAIGISASIGGIVAFGKSVFDSASQIHDMGEQLGISAEAVQGFKFAAEQAGSSLDAVGTAITKMNKNLAEGDTGTVKALKDAGLEFSTIRAMKPEDAFLTITDAIAKIPDPMERSDLALKLFGKSAAELLPAITEGFRAASDGASKMSNATIDALERAQDAWSQLGNKVTIVSGTILAGTIDTTVHITSSWGNFWQFMKDSASMGVGMAAALATANERIKTSVDEFVGPLESKLHATKEATDAATVAADKYAAAWAELNSLGPSYAETVATISPKLAEQAGYYLRIGGSIAAVAAAFPELSAAQVKALDEMGKQYEATYKKIQEIETNHVKQQETNYLGLSKAENDFHQKQMEDWSKANGQIEALNAQLTDEYNKQTMSRAAYEDQALWASAEKRIAAFQATGATAQQVTQFTNTLYETTALKASQLDWTAQKTLDNVGAKATGILAAIQMAIQQVDANLAVDLTGNALKAGGGGPLGMQAPLNISTPIYATPVYGAERSQAPVISKFASGVQDFGGGMAIVGEQGPELVNLPSGSSVLPAGSFGGTSVVNHFYVNGTAADVARQVADVLMRSLRGTQQLTLR